MSPEYRPGDLLLVLPLPTRPSFVAVLVRFLVLRRGMTVIVTAAAHLGRPELKRIRSLAGDEESWGAGASRLRDRVPRRSVFVVGAGQDTAIPPADSRSYGPLPLQPLADDLAPGRKHVYAAGPVHAARVYWQRGEYVRLLDAFGTVIDEVVVWPEEAAARPA